MPRPSLFRHAPSELSQDAFLAWLIEWADPSCIPLDPAMHAAGRMLLAELLACAGLPCAAADDRVVVLPQENRIDLLVLVGDSTVLVIEDKVHAVAHGNQLERYMQVAKARVGSRLAHVSGVFLKTGDQADTAGVRMRGFPYFGRARLLRILQHALVQGLRNDIMLDFTQHLGRMQERVDAWRNQPVASWHVRADLWRGVFDAIQERLGTGGWGWVNNRAGGFYGLWWCGHDVAGGRIYLQADSWPRLSVRVSGGSPDLTRPLRVRWQGHLSSAVVGSGLDFHRPERPRSGKSAEAARLAGSWVAATESGMFDLETSVAQLRRSSEWLKTAVANGAALVPAGA